MNIKYFLPLCAGLLFAGCSSDDEGHIQPNETEARRTVLVYMAAQNSLGLDNYHKQDSIEIMRGRHYLDDSDRMLMFIDDDQNPRLYRVVRQLDHPILIKKWDKDYCSTDPKFFEEVLNVTREAFPTREFGLVMWSHADGWIPSVDKDYEIYGPDYYASAATMHPFSFGIDSGPYGNLSNRGATMDTEDLAQAIQNAGLHCKFVFFDACLMQNLEVAYALRKATDYLIAAPMSTPAAGSYYTHNIQKAFFSADPANIARTYLEDVQAPELNLDYSDYGLAISCIRTEGMEKLAQAVKRALPHSKLMGRQSPQMVVANAEEPDQYEKVLNYQAYTFNYFYRPHNYDALQAFRCILDGEGYQEVKSCLDQVVTFYGSTQQFWIGPGYRTYQDVPVESGDFRAVSAFIPQEVYTENANDTRLHDLNRSFQKTEWYKDAGFAVTGW